MPPKKSVEGKPAAAKGAEDETPSKSHRGRDSLGVEGLTLPRTMIQRLAKGVLPANTQIQKDALLAIHKSATVFVSYLADSANDRASLANKKTVQPKDVFEALAELEFEAFLPRCEAELNVYNNIQCTKRNDYRRRVKVERGAANESALPDTADTNRNVNGSDADDQPTGPSSTSKTNGMAIRGHDSPPAAKKARVSLSGSANDMEGDGDSADEVTEDMDDEDDPAGLESEEVDDVEDEEDMGEEAENELEEDPERRYGPEGDGDGDEQDDLGGSDSD